jgi:hypothetical protein
MPMKLNVGISRKVGEANYGSRGASVSFDVELEANLVHEPQQLRERVRYLFGLAEEAVEEELRGHGQEGLNDRNSNGHGGNGNRPANGRKATVSQVRAIHAIAVRNGVDLEVRLREEFHVSRPDDLSIGDASKLIDSLKGQPNGAGGRR